MTAEGFQLSAVRRETVGRTPEQVRRAGYIPAVLYGHGVENLHVAVEKRTLLKLLPALSSSTLMTLTVDADPRKVLVHDIQRHPLTGLPIHVDFYQVKLTETIRVTVPLVFEGVAPAVKDLGGTLVKSLDAVDVEALPQNLPEHIVVDIRRLAIFDDHIRVQDLAVPEGVEILDDPDEAVAVVTPPRTEKELEELEEEVEEKAGEVKTEAEEKKAADEAGKREPSGEGGSPEAKPAKGGSPQPGEGKKDEKKGK